VQGHRAARARPKPVARGCGSPEDQSGRVRPGRFQESNERRPTACVLHALASPSAAAAGPPENRPLGLAWSTGWSDWVARLTQPTRSRLVLPGPCEFLPGPPGLRRTRRSARKRGSRRSPIGTITTPTSGPDGGTERYRRGLVGLRPPSRSPRRTSAAASDVRVGRTNTVQPGAIPGARW